MFTILNWSFPYDGKVIMPVLLKVFVNFGTYDYMMLITRASSITVFTQNMLRLLKDAKLYPVMSETYFVTTGLCSPFLLVM